MAFFNAISIPYGDLIRVFPVDPATPGDPVVDLRSCLYHRHGVGHVWAVTGAEFLATSCTGLVLVQMRETMLFALRDHPGWYFPLVGRVNGSPPQQSQR